MHGSTSPQSFLIPEDVVIIEDDAADDVVVVRSVQMAEDEAYARSLQVQPMFTLLLKCIFLHLITSG